MTRQRIHVQRYGWDVEVYYDSDRHDAAEILGELKSVGVDAYTYRLAERNLMGGLPDTGLTYSNPYERVSVVVLSHASSCAEFANTWFHEVGHCAKHIAKAVGLDCEGEAVNYVGGELARDMQPVAVRFMCPTCKHSAP